MNRINFKIFQKEVEKEILDALRAETSPSEKKELDSNSPKSSIKRLKKNVVPLTLNMVEEETCVVCPHCGQYVQPSDKDWDWLLDKRVRSTNCPHCAKNILLKII